MRIIGLMSGTSYDAIDVACAEFRRDGDVLYLEPLGELEVPHPDAVREAISAAMPPREVGLAQVCRLDTELGQAFAAAARRGLDELAGGRADLVVSHGQTLFHWVEGPRARGTLQLGQPAWIAERTGVPVLSDVRSADIARGGQGAPLVPVFDALLLGGAQRMRAALNLGGIANLTVLRDGEPVLGYDVGPGNALIDAACRSLLGEGFDAGGRVAAAGRVLPELLADLRSEPYFALPPPKSTGRELFHWPYLAERLRRLDEPSGTPAADVVATVTELTAVTVAEALAAHKVAEVVASGGGIRNPVLLRRLRELTAAAVTTVDEYGIPSDAKEAYAFALLGYLSWHGLPGALASVTGAHAPAILGSLTPGAGPLRLPEPAASLPVRLVVAAG